LIFCSLIFVFPLQANADPVFDRLEGAWAVESWQTTLLKTKSPRAAQNAVLGTPPLSHLIFNQKNGSYHIDMLMNCGHEGDQRDFAKIRAAVSGASHEYELIFDTSEPASVWARVTVLSANRIRFVCQRYKTDAVYFKLGQSIPRFINEKVFAGSYTDGKGGTYVFSKDGQVNWHGKKGKYKLFFDFIPFTGVDIVSMVFEDGHTNKAYGFETKHGTKVIYDLTNDEALTVKKEPPLLILKPVKKASR
jgi:hypothetical protein